MNTNVDVNRLLIGLIGAEMQKPHATASGQPCTLTISRDHACGGEEIAHMLSKKLELQCYDHELLDAIVAEAHTDRYLWERLDEHVTPMLDDWIYGLISGHGAANEDYRRHLAHVLLGISSRGGVIVGRGAHLLLATRQVWRVRVTGTPEICARRLAQQEHITEKEALATIRQINGERILFMRKQFGCDINNLASYDLSINTDKLVPTDAADVIIFSMKKNEDMIVS
ncbi:MAG: cytidylate kinase-like family protein [Planctomycetota bacterium]